VVLGYFRSAEMTIDAKSDLSPVTIADKESEAVMRALIEDTFPDHGIIGEEMDDKTPDAEFVWVLDPIDGTQSFVTGKPLFGTLIGLLQNRKPVLGIINMPALNERWLGVSGQPTTFNGKPAQVRACASVDKVWLYATSPQMFKEDDFPSFERLRKAAWRAVYGAECMAYGMLASGWVDIVCEGTMDLHDYAPMVPIVEGAGGVISDWRGEALGIGSDGTVLASANEVLHGEAIGLLGK